MFIRISGNSVTVLSLQRITIRHDSFFPNHFGFITGKSVSRDVMQLELLTGSLKQQTMKTPQTQNLPNAFPALNHSSTQCAVCLNTCTWADARVCICCSAVSLMTRCCTRNYPGCLMFAINWDRSSLHEHRNPLSM